MASPRHIDWSLEPLGLFPDLVVGAQLGVTGTAVYFARKSRRIPACRFPKIGRSKLGITWDEWPLGLFPDSVLATNIGCDFTTVHKARKTRCIPSFRTPNPPPCDREALRPLLGKKRDREVAVEMGVSEGQVSAARRALGIPSTRVDWD